MVLNALSLTSNVTVWLRSTRVPRILHIFERACNLINEAGEVLSVVTLQIGNGPFTLVLDEDIYFHDFIDIESSITISSDQLQLGDLTISSLEAELWNPRPDWTHLHAEKNNFFNRVPLTDYHPVLPQSLLSNLSSALARVDVSSAKRIASRLAGLGVGLTPSGDDFLMGAIYAVWILHPPKVAAALAQEIANTAAPLTTSLSAAWLRSAAKGEAGILWHEFLKVLMTADTELIRPAMDKILSVGETSGRESMAGFIHTLTAASS